MNILYEDMFPHPLKIVLADTRRDVIEMQDAGRRLDDVFRGLTGAGEAVVPGHGEVLITAGAVL